MDIVRVAQGGYSPEHMIPTITCSISLRETEIDIADACHRVQPGALVGIPRGVVHAVRNAGDGDLVLVWPSIVRRPCPDLVKSGHANCSAQQTDAYPHASRPAYSPAVKDIHRDCQSQQALCQTGAATTYYLASVCGFDLSLDGLIRHALYALRRENESHEVLADKIVSVITLAYTLDDLLLGSAPDVSLAI